MNDQPSQVSKRHTTYALIILVLINSINYMDRYVVSILLPGITEDLSLTDTQAGLLTGLAFALFYALMALPIGMAVDRFVRKYVLAAGILVWSFATFASGLVGRFASMFAVRALTGAGESSAHPSGVSLLGDYFSQKFRTTAIAIFQMGVPIGAGLGLILGGILVERFGWRQTFFIYAAPGVILIPLILMMKEPIRGASEGLTEKDSENIMSEGFWTKVRKILSLKTLIYHYIATALIMFASQGFSMWLPTYLIRERGFTEEFAGTITGVGYLIGGFVGALGGAIIADRWFRRDKKGRIKVQSLAALLAIPFVFIALFRTNNAILIPGILMAIILSIAMFPILSAIIVDLTEPQDRGVAMALLLLFQTGIGFSLGPTVVGWISDLTGSLMLGLLAMPTAYLAVTAMGLLAMRHVVPEYEAVQEKIAGYHTS